MKIDSVDINTYGLYLLRDSLGDVIRFPKRKAININDWAESDGIEPDLTVSEFEAKTVNLKFGIKASDEGAFWGSYNRVMAVLSAPGYRQMDFDLGVVYPYRFSVQGSYTIPIPETPTVSIFSMSFIEDRPELQIGKTTTPTGGHDRNDGFYLNGISFGEFGMWMESGTDDLLKYPSVKSPFTDGLNVDLTTVCMKHKEVTLKLTLVAGNPAQFWQNHAALFHQLADPGMQTLTAYGIDIPFFYTDCPSATVEEWASRIAVTMSVRITIPVVTWVDAGGNTKMAVLVDDDHGILTDENGTILILA
ncbi:MAG: hypothetical protein LUH01_17310 [Parabacteroides gordonii]|nr:hypothetical protein [Parabacteroides gordonii]